MYEECIFLFLFSVGPTKVSILNGREPISSGKRYEVNCQTVGARPQPTVTWWMAGKQVSSCFYYSFMRFRVTLVNDN
jgi:hypothetical protein